MLHYPKTRGDWLALRLPVVTSTESPALVGESPYLTKFELWHQKKEAKVVDLEPSEVMTWGTRLQDTIARGIAEDHGVKVRKLTAFAIHDNARLGASFDFEIIGEVAGGPDTELRRMYAEHGPGVLEIKNVGAFAAKEWTDDDVPPHIDIQHQHQLECIDRNWGVIAALVGGNKPIVLPRLRDRAVGQGLIKLATEFWRTVEAGTPPAPDFVADAGLLSQIYGHAEPGTLLDARSDAKIRELCAAYAAAGERERAAKEEKSAAKSELLTLIGAHEKVLADGFTISAGVIGPALVEAYTRDGYRNFRVTQKKAKA